jgi:phosphate uptake regulator
MPTQEERLTTLEQTTAANIREINENLTMALGLIQRQAFDTSKINRDIKSIRERLEVHFEATNTHFNLLQKQVDTIQTTLAQILERLPEKP